LRFTSRTAPVRSRTQTNSYASLKREFHYFDSVWICCNASCAIFGTACFAENLQQIEAYGVLALMLIFILNLRQGSGRKWTAYGCNTVVVDAF